MLGLALCGGITLLLAGIVPWLAGFTWGLWQRRVQLRQSWQRVTPFDNTALANLCDAVIPDAALVAGAAAMSGTHVRRQACKREYRQWRFEALGEQWPVLVDPHISCNARAAVLRQAEAAMTRHDVALLQGQQNVYALAGAGLAGMGAATNIYRSVLQQQQAAYNAAYLAQQAAYANAFMNDVRAMRQREWQEGLSIAVSDEA